jgi:Apea-like HEPN
MGDPPLTTHALRKRWKPAKEALHAERPDHPTSIRLHRAFSWLARCETVEAETDEDLVLVFGWIAFNALYGQWDSQRREPVADGKCWRDFLDRVLKIDSAKHVSRMLVEQRELVMAILDDEYLSSFFWEEPTDLRASKSKKSKFDARTWYIDGKWNMVLDRLCERIYLLRCQMVHGAATFGGRLNRPSLRRSNAMLRHLLNAVLLVVIDAAGEEDWGTMCYPPLKSDVITPRK